MTAKEWDAIETRYCSNCAYDKRGAKACPVKRIMHTNPKDIMASQLIRDGKCTQYSRKVVR